MKLLNLLRQESTIPLGRLALIAGLAGLSNALVLAIINNAASHASNNELSFRYLLLFGIAMAVYILSQRHIMVTSTKEVEAILHQIRLRLADKIRHSDLEAVEKIGHSRIYASVSKEILTISQATTMLVIACQSAILIFFTVIYIALLTRPGFFLFLFLMGGAVLLYQKRALALNEDLHTALQRENKLFDVVTHFLDGFKEVRMNSARSDDLYAHLEEVSASVASLKADTQTRFAMLFIFAQTAFCLLLASMVFLLPQLSTTYSDVVIKATTAILFIIGPISTLVGALPVFASASVAIENVYALEKELDKKANGTKRRRAPLASFQEIRLAGVSYQYDDPRTATPFHIGPVDLTISAGEVLFIAGGNGSGKSTLLKLLTALYYPQSGAIHVDGRQLNQASYQSYRDLFSVIFSDYHLFDRLYGLGDVDGQPDRLLKRMQLTGKTSVIDGGFETLDLSGGQKKRLAMVVSLLEDKPIYIFDEWAADQDPEFRKSFYRELLKELKQRGKTVIAVTHDDKYFDASDRLLKMEEGRLVEAVKEY